MAKRATLNNVFGVVELPKCFVPLVGGKATASLKNLGKAVLATKFMETLRQGKDAGQAFDASLEEIRRGMMRLNAAQLRTLATCLAIEAFIEELKGVASS